MGDRGNIVVRQSPADIYLYTHWAGSNLRRTLVQALDRGRDRWDDEAYLTRIIFCQMVREDWQGTTGFGISTKMQDNEHPLIYVDTAEQTVNIEEEGTYSFENFIKRFK